jgi:hypothetical protein
MLTEESAIRGTESSEAADGFRYTTGLPLNGEPLS